MDFLHRFHKHCDAYVGYPGNHNLYVCDGKIKPSRQLNFRYQRIAAHYPQPLTSFLDLSSCKGYFVFKASEASSCERSVGIDVNVDNIALSNKLGQQLGYTNTRFEELTLMQLADNIEQYGGAFQTVVLVNTYQYLYFGSKLGAGSFSHDKLFEAISKVCAQRFIFNNRVELENCQNKVQVAAIENTATQNYNRQSILDAASRYFKVKFESTLGRYPLWVFEKL